MNDVSAENQPKKNGNGLWVLLGLIVIAAAAAGAYYYYSHTNQGATASAVARVNGEEISQAEYDRSVMQISGAYTAQGMDVSGSDAAAAIKEQALNTLVNRRLMADAAAKAGISVADSEIDTEYQNVLSGVGGQEGLAAALSQSGMNEEELRAELKTDILINKYLESQLRFSTISVSDEEVQAAYDTATKNASSSDAVPALADVHDLVKNQLLTEKQQAAINTELERLRQEATIEVLI